ncbi:MAG: hypothetical protein RLZZ126_1240 [Pseudomonadota bacterium]|jgi:diguanylate cyclase (GGDEF)-like protein/PAS domain S-box-containing protein
MTAQTRPRSRGDGIHESDYSFAVNLMQFLVVPTFVLDNQGKVLIWNKACERLTGVAAAEVVGTKEHWKAFYEAPRPCLSDLVVENRMDEIDALYVQHDDPQERAFGVHAENWCRMPKLGNELYLAIDAGPIFDQQGKLLAVVETLRDISVQKRAQTELEHLANHDGLTGMVNRRSFDHALETAWQRGTRDQSPLSLLMVDVDYFKRYNDTYGHQAGDECLKGVAKALAGCVSRPTDHVARYGGEEFAVVLSACTEKGAQTVAQRMLGAVSALAIPHSGNEASPVVTISIGIATAIPTPSQLSPELILQADQALYRAKHSGRNRFKH